MPVKFKKSDIIRLKTGAVSITHHYMSQMPVNKLFDYINGEENCKPKQRVKCIRELEKRKIPFVWHRTPKNSHLELEQH